MSNNEITHNEGFHYIKNVATLSASHLGSARRRRLPPRTGTINSQRRVAMHVAPRAVNRSLLLELAGDNSPEGRADEREYEDGRDHLAHATSVAETTPDHTQHTAHNLFLWVCCRALPLPVAGSKKCFMYTGK